MTYLAGYAKYSSLGSGDLGEALRTSVCLLPLWAHHPSQTVAIQYVWSGHSQQYVDCSLDFLTFLF